MRNAIIENMMVHEHVECYYYLPIIKQRRMFGGRYDK